MAAASPRATGPVGAAAAVLSAGAGGGVVAVDVALSLEVLLQDANATPRRATDSTRYRGFMTGSFPDGKRLSAESCGLSAVLAPAVRRVARCGAVSSGVRRARF